jgi:peptidyl-prolyl cis-trans isomerase A (cyclophilin A)
MRHSLLLGLLSLSLLASCSPKQEAADSSASAAPTASPVPAPPAAVPAETAPAQYKVRLATTKGDIVIQVERDWAPIGADRFYTLVKDGYYDNNPWFRVMGGFMAQTGLNPDPKRTAAWREQNLQDDPVKASNTPGTLTFAMGGPNTRTTHFFINTGDNTQLDGMGFAPIGKVIEGLDVVKALYEIGDSTVEQGRANDEGEEYFKTFPKMDRIKTARVE